MDENTKTDEVIAIANEESDDNMISTAPWHIFVLFGIGKRILILLMFVIALVAVTGWGINNDIHIVEIISGYVTVIFLLWLSAIDLQSYILPNKILLIWLSCRVILLFIGLVVTESPEILIQSMGGAGAMGLIFLIIHYLSKRSLGGGDVKLSFVLGLSLTMTMVFTAMFYAVVACSIVAIVGLILKKLNRKDSLPLGPFIFIGTVVAYLFHLF